MLRSIIFIVVAAIAVCPYMAYGQSYGQLTVTENLIRREIIRLGGDWEAGTKPLLVSFMGGKFESMHFEMLTHLPSVEHFHADGCVIDHFALACLSQVRQLKRLEITGCKLESKCLSLLRGNRELQKIYFESITLSDELITEVSKLKHIKTAVFIDCEGMTEERLSTLRAAMPNAIID